MRTDEYNYLIPKELIAQQPAPRRDSSRLLVLHRADRTWRHALFAEFPSLLRAGDLLVVNNSKVLPARLRASKPGAQSSVEVFLVEEVRVNEWWVLLRPGKRVRTGDTLRFRDRLGAETSIQAAAGEKNAEGHCRLFFSGTADLKAELDRLGEIPLPPYIQRPSGPEAEDSSRYQTIYAQPAGSVAAPTAGLHFTPQIMEQIRRLGVEIAEVTLHVGLGTFAPVKVENPAEHVMHAERFELGERAAELIRETRARGNRVFAAGTTTLRVLETVAALGEMRAMSGTTRLFARPPYRFRAVDALLTNFHLPESTLLMLVSAFASPEKEDGRQFILDAYAAAIQERYRFFSYGDAMAIL